MKTNFTFIFTTLLSLLFSTYSYSQYEEIYNFEDSSTFNGYDAEEDMNLILIGDYFYGMRAKGGLNGIGTIFRVKNDGSDFDKLLDFEFSQYGGFPYGSLYFDGTYLYGTTTVGEPLVEGTIFRILPDGTGYERLIDFTDVTTGARPQGTLVSDGVYLYGCAVYDGSLNDGNIFKIMPDGSNFQVIHSFENTNLERPIGSLIFDGTFLYGTTRGGGNSDHGSIFKVRTDGTDFTKLFDFNNNTTGGLPRSQLLLADQYLYGLTSSGGNYNAGTIFKIKTDGTGFQKLEDFDNALKGGEPVGSLVIEDSVLYGVCQNGGTEDHGTFFRVDTSGANYQVLENFSLSIGTAPSGAVIKVGNSFYGMTPFSGANKGGTVFQVDMSDTTTSALYDFGSYMKGLYPTKELVIVDSLVYGTTTGGGGGDNAEGTIFRMEKDGSNHQLLHTFEDYLLGASPNSGLTYDGTFLYGTTHVGGQLFNGTVYRIKPDGSQFSVLVDFDDTIKGVRPSGQLELDENYLYGVTRSGGELDKGVLFKVGKNGLGFEKIHDFQGGTDGTTPKKPILIDDTLYGVTVGAGRNDHSVIYKSSTDGSFYEIIFNFTMNPNSGIGPHAGLIHHNNLLYGTCRNGGTNNVGTIFSVSKDGSNFNVIHNFILQYGRLPDTKLIEHDNYIYGTTRNGGTEDSGILFRIRDNGSHFEKLIDFKDQTNGFFPGSLIFSEEHFYGTTANDQRPVNTGVVYRYKVYDFCASNSVDEIISCDPITWMDGNTYDTTNNEATFILTNSNGCDSTIFLDLTITPVLSISQYAYSLVSNAQNASYQWVDCNDNYAPIPGETNQEFYFSENGNYAVLVTQNGCTDTSECITVSDVSVPTLSIEQVKIYPNPTDGKLYIKSKELTSVQVMDAMGRVIATHATSSQSHSIDLSAHKHGVYIVQVNDSKQIRTYRVVLK